MENNNNQPPVYGSETNVEWQQQFYRYFIGSLLIGFEIILPIGVFIVVLRIIFSFVANLLEPISSLFTSSSEVKPWFIDFLSFLIAIICIFLIGALVKTKNGRTRFNQFEDQWLNQLPFYNTIRTAVTQIVSNRKRPFSQVVLVDIFNNDTRMTAFITEEVNEDLYTIFVPTGPNPANGNIYHVSRSQLTFLPTKTEEAMRTILGVGTGSSIFFKERVVEKLKKERSDHENKNEAIGEP